MSEQSNNLKDFQDLLQVIKKLRGPEGCPWDKAQTHSSLSPYAVEEAFELAEALEQNDPDHIKEELGDVLLQVLLHSTIAQETGTFTLNDVISGLKDKMIRRHPHVFGDKASTMDKLEAKKQWEAIKAKENEKNKKNDDGAIQFNWPKGLPSLMASHRIGEQSGTFNFDWKSIEPVLEKVEEEWTELKLAITTNCKDDIEHELGDLLFSVAQLGRHLELNAEQALRRCNLRFGQRWSKMQEIANKQGLVFRSLGSTELEELWAQAKQECSDASMDGSR